MATAGPEMGKFIRDQLASRNISYHPARKTVTVDAERHGIRFEDGSEANYDLLVTVPPHVAPAVVREAGLVTQSGWIPADPLTLKISGDSGFRSVFAIGDVAVVALPGRYKRDMPLVLPKAGTMADAQGQVVASQIASQVLGGSADVFGGLGTCYIETGAQHAVKGEGNFFALPHPVMRASPPDSARSQGKLAWMADGVRACL
jgi:sulfide:quinone oxidoreductase